MERKGLLLLLCPQNIGFYIGKRFKNHFTLNNSLFFRHLCCSTVFVETSLAKTRIAYYSWWSKVPVIVSAWFGENCNLNSRRERFSAYWQYFVLLVWQLYFFRKVINAQYEKWQYLFEWRQLRSNYSRDAENYHQTCENAHHTINPD